MKHSLPATTPFWTTTAEVARYSALAADDAVDVVVVGGGITGLTAAYLLSRASKRVVVLERDRCGNVDTGHTTAHLTMVTDTRLSDLVKQISREHAQAVWDAGLAAINQIDEIVRSHGIDASLEWVDGYLHAPVTQKDDAPSLEDDAALARELGFDAEYLSAVPLVGRPGIRFDGQARVHPRQYLAGLAAAIVDAGGRIHEHSSADEFCEAPRAVKSNNHTIRCDDVVLATHNPLVGLAGLVGSALFQTKLALYTSYAVAARVPAGTVPDALWWDTANPYTYIRVQPASDHDVVIVGGEDHKTGQHQDPQGCYERLIGHLGALVPSASVTHRWSGQVIETPDGLPYIGQSAEHQYLATGFAGNGMTFGTLAAMMVSDAILGRRNPWSELFDPGRKALGWAGWEYIKENADYPYYLIRDRFAGTQGQSLRAVKRGEGKVITHKGSTVAASRNAAGTVTLRSAYCTHMGCLVHWNTAERTWDCPCHGSRFAPDGTVISGPAEAPLSDVE